MPIHYEADDHVVTITIDRPARRNALDMEHFDALADAWKRFRDDGDSWVAIVTGVDDAFCAGGDLRDYIPLLAAAGPDDRDRFTSGTEAVLRDLDIYKPIIAAVNGPCVAGGMEMLNGTDIRLACPEAVFGMLEPRRGIFASGGTTARLPRQIPWPAAMEFLLTAEPVPATRALEMGLLNEIVPRHQLLDRAQEWAERITANAPLAVAATKESALRGMAVATLEEAFRIEARLSRRVLDSNDAREGPLAFTEKRAPHWTGT
jgi:enoyl-CoA hydratase